MAYDLNGMGPLIRRDPKGMGGVSAWGGDAATADANSPLPALLDSIAQFDFLGVPRTQVVMALPWYGDDYACVEPAAGGPCHAPCKAALGCGRQIQ
eukprot:COSAG04_NODE_215_length_20056_cov_1614.026958_2_plen_96_part_00